MVDLATDQAAGLRRMFRRSDVPLIAFAAAPGAGGSETVCAYARRLAARGLSVTLIDEHRAGVGAAARLSVATRFDLAQAAAGDLALSQVVTEAGERLRLVAAARFAESDADDAGVRVRLAHALKLLGAEADVLLIDAAGGEGGRLSPIAVKAGSLVAVTGSAGGSVTGAYLMLRHIAPARPQLRLALAVHRASGERQAAAIFENMRELARRQLRRELQAWAWLPAQPREIGIDSLQALDTLLPPSLRQPAPYPDDEPAAIATDVPRQLRLAAVNNTRD